MDTQNSLVLPSGIISNVFTDTSFIFLQIFETELGVYGYYLVNFLQTGCPKSRSWLTFSVKGQIVNVLGFASHTICVTTM